MGCTSSRQHYEPFGESPPKKLKKLRIWQLQASLKYELLCSGYVRRLKSINSIRYDGLEVPDDIFTVVTKLFSPVDKWNSEFKSNGVIIKGVDENIIECESHESYAKVDWVDTQSYKAYSTREVYSRNTHIWNIKILRLVELQQAQSRFMKELQIGVRSTKQEFNELGCSYQWTCISGVRSYLGDYHGTGRKYGVTCKEGDTITVKLDLHNRLIVFGVNGIDQGVAFSGIKTDVEYHAYGETKSSGVIKYRLVIGMIGFMASLEMIGYDECDSED